MASWNPDKAAGISGDDVELDASTGSVGPLTSDQQALKKATLKTDLTILPMLAVTYLFNSLDRSNLANAKTGGLASDLHLKGNQYNLVLSFYFITFVLFGPPMTTLTRRIGAKYSIPIMVIGFGIASASTAAVKSFGSLVACRMFVGLFEAGFLPSVVYYLSTWYTKRQVAKRIAIFYAASVCGSAFGGLLAFGVFHIKNAALFPWSYLFILEGCLTCLAGIVAFFVLPSTIQGAWFLNEAEKNALLLKNGNDSKQTTETKINWKEATMELRGIHFYIRALIGISFGVILATNSNFLAIIVQRLGYSTVKTNLYTVAPALTAAVFLVIYCASSDYFLDRGFHMAAVQIPTIIGYAILMAVNVTTQRGVSYFAIFLCTIGAYPMSIIYSTWIVTNIPNLSSRAFATGSLIALGNAAGLISSNIFFADEAPIYRSALIGNMTCSVVCLALCLAYTIWMRFENRSRDKLYGKVGSASAPVESWKDKNFRFAP